MPRICKSLAALALAAVATTSHAAFINLAPMANLGGPYTVQFGQNVLLDASASSDPNLVDGDVLSYSWDLTNDGVYEVNTGTSATLALLWSDLVAGHHDVIGSTYVVRVKVTDLAGAYTQAAAALQIVPAVVVAAVPEPASLALVGLGLLGAAVAFGRSRRNVATPSV